MSKEAMKLALEWFQCFQDKSMSRNNAEALADEVINALREALAEQLAQQEPWCMKMNGCKTKCEDCPVEVLPAQQKPVLQEIEQYRLQMAGICTAAIGYWKEGDGIHPDYDTVALRDVAKLYAKYDELYREQPAQQEPVGDITCWTVKGHLKNTDFDYYGNLSDGTHLLYASPPAQQEPVGKVNELFDEAVIEQCGFDRELLVYTSPPAQRQLLTDEQMREVLRTCQSDVVELLRSRWLYVKEFAGAIEAAHGIKENT